VNWLQPGGFLAMDLRGLSGSYLVAIDVYGAKTNAAGSAHWQLGFTSLPDQVHGQPVVTRRCSSWRTFRRRRRVGHSVACRRAEGVELVPHYGAQGVLT